jgi:TorA maturation chaperone TorD
MARRSMATEPKGAGMSSRAESSRREEHGALCAPRPGAVDTFSAAVAREDAQARANMYGFLSAVYLSPMEECLLRKIVDEDLLAELSWLFGAPAAAELNSFATGVDVTEHLGTLRQEFMDLFAVPTGRYVSPFEDVYGGGSAAGELQRGPLLGARAIAVRRFYRQAGAEVDRACKELPTHVGVELAFMRFLCEREAAALSQEAAAAEPGREGKAPRDSVRYRELQRRFLREHLNEWFPRLSRSIMKQARSPLYRGLSLVTEEFVAREAESLAAPIEPSARTPEPGRPGGGETG